MSTSNEWKLATLEQSMKLVELGVLLETERWISEEGTIIPVGFVGPKTANDCKRFGYYPDPDVAELGMVLPHVLQFTDWRFLRSDRLFVRYDTKLWAFEHDINDKSSIVSYLTEAQARCAALIWLIENHHLKAEDIKL